MTCTEVRGKDSIGCSRDDLLRAEKGGMLDFVFLLPYSRLIEQEKQRLFATDEDSFFFIGPAKRGMMKRRFGMNA